MLGLERRTAELLELPYAGPHSVMLSILQVTVSTPTVDVTPVILTLVAPL